MQPQKQGSTVGRYPVIARTLIFLTYNQEVLLLQGAPTKHIWAELYNGIGGHVEAGETPLQGARRELLEETGIATPKSLHLCGVLTISVPDAEDGIMLFVFTGEANSYDTKTSEEGQLGWFDWRTLPENDLVEDLPILLPLALAHKPGDPPFWGLYSYPNGKLNIAIHQ